MSLFLFAFSLNEETKEAVFSGNITPQVALQLLQNIVIQTAIKQLQDEKKVKEQSEPSKEG